MRLPRIILPVVVLAVLASQPGMAREDEGGKRQVPTAGWHEEGWAPQAENHPEIARQTTGPELRYAPTLQMRELEFREFVAKIRSHLSAEHVPFYGGRPEDCDASREPRAARAVWASGTADVSVLTSVISCAFDFRGGLTPSGVAPGGYLGFTVLLYAAPYTEIAHNESNARDGQRVALVSTGSLQGTTPALLLDDVRVLMRGTRPTALGKPFDSPARIARVPCESYTEPLYTARTIEQPIDVVTAWSEFSQRLARLGCLPAR